jgi:hypothetical protein
MIQIKGAILKKLQTLQHLDAGHDIAGSNSWQIAIDSKPHHRSGAS